MDFALRVVVGIRKSSLVCLLSTKLLDTVKNKKNMT